MLLHLFGASGTSKEQVALEIYRQSPRSQKPHIIVDAGGAGLIGKHDPKSERSETYNRSQPLAQSRGLTAVVV